MIFSGSLGEISNKAAWTSRVYTLVYEKDGTEIDLSNPDLGTEIEFIIRKANSKQNEFRALLSDGSGKVILNGSGFQWVLSPDDLQNLCPQTYKACVAVTVSGDKNDVMLAPFAIVEGV